jgi:hypothetical protein
MHLQSEVMFLGLCRPVDDLSAFATSRALLFGRCAIDRRLKAPSPELFRRSPALAPKVLSVSFGQRLHSGLAFAIGEGFQVIFEGSWHHFRRRHGHA